MHDPATAMPAPPLTRDAMDQLDALVASLSTEQLQWASGYLAGRAAIIDAVPLATADDAPRLTILYGSQTGNGRRVAEKLYRDVQARGSAAEMVSMADYPPSRLKREYLLAVIVSTHGEGDPPDDAIELHRFIGGRRVPSLPELRYAVLALGDSSYENFCQTGQDFDSALRDAGATALAPIAECDLDFGTAAADWSQTVMAEAARLTVDAPAPVTPTLRAVPDAPRWSRDTPYEAELLLNQTLTGRGSTKDVRHLELDLGDSGLLYRPGDALGVVAPNPQRIVEPLLEHLGLDGASILFSGEDQTLRGALTAEREITTLNRRFLDGWAGLPGNHALRELLAGLDGPGLGRWMATRQVVDVVREFRAEVTPDQFVALLRPMPPRLYSIASAPDFADSEVHLTVALVHYDAFALPHWGAASSWLSLDGAEGDRIPVFIEPNERFRLPADPDRPVIMIGPGTGVAPFRAFLQARDTAGAGGPNWLLFGDRHFASDFLYQSEWLRYRKCGLLNRLDVAFSRDGAEKHYVQHLMQAHGDELFAWLQDGAHLYVCGDATHMAPDVDRMLQRVISRHGGFGDDQTTEYLDTLRREGRYQRDVY